MQSTGASELLACGIHGNICRGKIGGPLCIAASRSDFLGLTYEDYLLMQSTH